MADASDPYVSLMTPLGASAPPPAAPTDTADPYDILTKPLIADPASQVSGYVAAGGRSTWGDVPTAAIAGVHGVGADIGGLAAATSRTPEGTSYWQDYIARQQKAKADSEAALTPAAQQPGFFQHPLVSTAEATPGIAAVVGPSALAGPFAPLVGAGLMAGQATGQTYDEMLEQALASGMSREEADAKIKASGALPGAAALGAATGLFPEVTGPLVSKLAVSPLVGRVLSGGIEGTGFAASSAAGEYGTERGEQAMGTRKDLDVNQIVEAGRGGFEQGAAFGVFGHSGAHRNSTQTGGEATVPRTPEAQTATEAKPRASNAEPVDAPAAGPPPAPSPVGPAESAALNPEPVTPRVTEPPPVVQPESVQPKGAPAEDQQGKPPAAVEAQEPPPPQPPPESQPAARPTPPAEDPAVIQREPDATLIEQHAALTDKTNPREAMVYPPDVQPLDLPNKSRYGQGTLNDGRTIQYDRSGVSKLSKDKVKFADDNNRLNEILQLGPENKDQAVARVAAGEPGVGVVERTPDGGEAKAAAATSTTAPDTVAALEATKTPGNIVSVEHPDDVVAAREAGLAQEQAVQPQEMVAQPEVAITPESKSVQTPFGPGRVLEAQDAANIRARDAAAADDARQALAVQEQLKAKQAAKEQAALPAGGKGHISKDQQAKIVSHNSAADKIVAKHPFETLTHDFPNQIYTRAKAMLSDAKEAGVKIPKVFGEGHPWSASMLKLREAADLIGDGKRVPTHDDLGRFIDRERMIDEGRPEEAFAARRDEAAQGLGSPEGAVETAREGRIDDTEKPEDVKEAPAEHETIHETPTEHAAEGGGDENVVPLRERPKVVEVAEEGKHFTAGKAAMGFQQVTKKSRTIKRQEIEDEPKRVMATDTEGNPVGVTAQRSTTAEDAINEHFDPKRYSPELRPMMERLRDAIVRIAGSTPVHYISHEDMLSLGERARGLYDGNHILLNADKLTHDTALHEAFHAATAKALDADPELRDLMERLQQEMGDKSDPEEFLTRLMTDDKLQNQFKTARISPELARDVGIPKWRKATMWEGALNLFRRALGMGPRDVSAIEAAMSISEKAMWKRDPGMAMEAGARSLGLRFQKMGPEELGDLDGDKLGRSVKGMTRKLGALTKDMATDASPKIKKAGDRLSSEPQLYDMHKELFTKEVDGKVKDHMRDRLDGMQKRAGRADELSEPGHELARQTRIVANEHGPDVMARGEAVMKTMNELGVWPHHELGEGKNAHLAIRKGAAEDDVAMDKWQARGAHPELAKDFKALPEPVQDNILAQAKHYTDTYNALAKEKARSYIEGVEPPEGSTQDEVVQRMLNDTLTDADKEHYAEKGIKNLEADDFQKRKGPYFPAERYGDFVLQAEHQVPTPKGSDVEYDGTRLADNVRRFTTREEAHKFTTDMAKRGLPVGVSTRYHMEDAQGNRIYKVPGTDRRITSQEAASSGYSSPKREFYVKVQNDHVSFHKSMSIAQHAREALEQDGLKNISQVMDRRGRGVDKSFTSEQTRALLANVDRRTDLTDQQKEQMKDNIRETAVVSQSGSRIMKNFARSQKVQGAEYRGDAITHYTQSASRYLAGLEYQPKIDAAMDAMREITKERRADEHSTDRSRIMNEMTARTYNSRMDSLYPQYSPTMQRLMNVAYVTDMASASHLLTHQLNLHYMGASVIGARHGVLQTLRAFNQIMRQAGGPWMAIKHGFGAAMAHIRDPEANGVSMFNMMRNSLTSARERSVVDELVASQHIHKDSGLDLTPIGDSRSSLQRVSRFIRDASGSMDSMGRFVTGLAAYKMEYAKNGGDHEAALLYAKQSIEKGLTHYGAGMRAPALSGPMTRMVSQFRLPGMNMLYLLGRNAHLAFRSADKATRNEAYRTLGAMMIGGWALSGSSALPTEPLKLLGILGSALGITPTPSAINDEMRRGLANEFGSAAADVILDGPLSLLGPYAPSFAHRVASPELTFGEPDSSKPDDVQKWLAGMAFGAVGSWGVNVARGTQAAFGGDYTNAVKYLAPKQLADVARAYGLYSQGKTDAGGAAMQLFGVRSQQTVRQQEGQNALYNRIEADKKAKPKTKGELLKEAHAHKVMGQTVTRKNKGLLQEYENAYQ